MVQPSLGRTGQLVVHKMLCAGVAAAVAYAVTHGRAAPAVAAAAVVAVMTLAAWRNAARAGRPRRATAPRRRGRRATSFHAFVRRRLGSPRRPLRFAANFLVRPLLAGSFAGFWRAWNPPFAYVLLFLVYRPARRHLPRPVAAYVAFLASGVLHDLIANGGDLLRGRVDPSGTVLFAIFGAATLATEAAGVQLAPRPAWVRAAANASLLAAGFGLRHVVMAALR